MFSNKVLFFFNSKIWYNPKCTKLWAILKILTNWPIGHESGVTPKKNCKIGTKQNARTKNKPQPNYGDQEAKFRGLSFIYQINKKKETKGISVLLNKYDVSYNASVMASCY